MRRADAEDVALAACVVVVGQGDVFFPILSEPNVVGPPWVVAGAYAVTGAALAARRRSPLVVLGVVVGVTTALAVAFGASEGPGSLLPPLVAVYSAAAHGTRRQASAAAVATLGMVVVRELDNPGNTTWNETANAFAWNLTLAAAWLLGVYLRTRRLYTAELAARVARGEQERLEREREAVERERARIARELHDVIAHGVSVMVVQADAAEAVLPRDPDGTVVRLQHIQRTGREALTELRRLLGVLHPAPDDGTLTPQPGVADLDTLLTRLRGSGLRVELEVHGSPVRLPPGIDLAVHRVVQESLTNVLKHAGAACATVRLRYRLGSVEVDVCDDGPVPSPAGRTRPPLVATGHGLVGMRERVALCGGALEAGPDAERGYRVHARLPLRDDG